MTYSRESTSLRPSGLREIGFLDPGNLSLGLFGLRFAFFLPLLRPAHWVQRLRFAFSRLGFRFRRKAPARRPRSSCWSLAALLPWRRRARSAGRASGAPTTGPRPRRGWPIRCPTTRPLGGREKKHWARAATWRFKCLLTQRERDMCPENVGQ